MNRNCSARAVARALNGALEASSNPEQTLDAFGNGLGNSEAIRYLPAGTNEPVPPLRGKESSVPAWFTSNLTIPDLEKITPSTSALHIQAISPLFQISLPTSGKSGSASWLSYRRARCRCCWPRSARISSPEGQPSFRWSDLAPASSGCVRETTTPSYRSSALPKSESSARCVSAWGLDHDRRGGPTTPIYRNQWLDGFPTAPMGGHYSISIHSHHPVKRASVTNTRPSPRHRHRLDADDDTG